MHHDFITTHKNATNVTGLRFGRLVALGPVARLRRQIVWLCECDCGNTARVILKCLMAGETRSCGCLRSEICRAQLTTHGMRNSRLYKTWQSMKTRCTNPKSNVYAFYGGRGISVCDEWMHDFEAFHAYISQLPGFGVKGNTLDRIENNGNYCPGNVRWASMPEQQRNRRSNRKITHNGKTQCVKEWAEEFHMKHTTLSDRLERGWTMERALTQPVHK